MSYDVYLFDFDYTLVDAEAAILTCYRAVLKRHGHPDVPDGTIKRCIGKGVTEVLRTLTGVEDEAILQQYYEEYMQEADGFMTANTLVYPETVPVLRELKNRGKKTGIISNKLGQRIMEVLVKFDITDLFDVVIGSGEVTAPKPSPEGIFCALNRLGASKDDAIYTGDSLVDAKTAQNAAVAFAAVTTGATEAEEFHDFPRVMIMTDITGLL